MGVQKFKFKANRPKVVGNTHITPYWKVIEKIIDESDLILEVIDARMPHLSRNEDIESLCKEKGKDLAIIINKVDLISVKNIKDEIKGMKTFVISARNNDNFPNRYKFFFLFN